MKLRKHWTIVVMILMFITCFRGNVGAYNMAEYFPLNQGDKWTYLTTYKGIPLLMGAVVNGTEVVNEVETTKYENRILYLIVAQYICAVMDSNGMKIYKISDPTGIKVYNPPPLWFPAQFELGEVNQQSLSFSLYSTDGTFLGTATGTETISLESVEDVTVPAGTFKDCLKIIDSGSWQVSTDLYGELEHIFWLAQNVGPIKITISETYHSSGNSGGTKTQTMTSKLICANVNGLNYGCLATSALGGDARADDINALRKFRDEVLSKTTTGQELIELYYQWSPAIVKAMEEDEEFKEEVKEMIDGILGLIKGEAE